MIGGRLIVATMVASVVLCTDAGMEAARARQEAGQLREVFPDASDFSLKAGDLPYFEAFRTDPQTGRRVLAGFVFYTTDLEPLERGYTGPIKILVGMTIEGTLTGSKMIENREPFGYFTIDTSGFHDQFTGKSVFDQFEVGQDIDAVSGATVTVASATRSIRLGVRRIARQYLLDYSFRPAPTTP
ncbi:MAG: FMN-binding protein [Vicinamibacterales bacterium]|nr:FMN-binding protein [Vicinamibacterales bacterium]